MMPIANQFLMRHRRCDDVSLLGARVVTRAKSRLDSTDTNDVHVYVRWMRYATIYDG
jgi:hypothetical protein